jgi:hypothetical protein
MDKLARYWRGFLRVSVRIALLKVPSSVCNEKTRPAVSRQAGFEASNENINGSSPGPSGRT